jgi:hypothetical protein
MRLRKLEWFALSLAVASVTVEGIYGYRKIPALLPAMLILWLTLGLLALVGALQAVGAWRTARRRVFILPAIAVCGFLVGYQAAGIGAAYRDKQFLGVLPAYQRVVDEYRSGAAPPGRLSLDSLPTDIRSCCYLVTGGRDSAGELFVEFWVERAFPVHHAAWLYYSGNSAREVARARAWYSGYKVAPHWYRVAD